MALLKVQFIPSLLHGRFVATIYDVITSSDYAIKIKISTSFDESIGSIIFTDLTMTLNDKLPFFSFPNCLRRSSSRHSPWRFLLVSLSRYWMKPRKISQTQRTVHAKTKWSGNLIGNLVTLSNNPSNLWQEGQNRMIMARGTKPYDYGSPWLVMDLHNGDR